MSVPWNVTFAAWMPFPISSVVGIILVLLYFIYYKGGFSCFSAFVSVSVVVISICTVVLLPVDVYLVSATKSFKGFHQDWATKETMIEMERIVLYGYYSVYGLMLLFIFGFIPFAYFASKSSNDVQVSSSKRYLRGAKYTVASIILLCILLVTGAVIPMGSSPMKNSTLFNQLNFTAEMGCMQSVAENALMFAYNFTGLIGMVCAIVYVTYGMAILPVNLIKGSPAERRETRDLELSIDELKEKIQDIMNKTADQRPLSEEDRTLLARYNHGLSVLESENDSLRLRSYRCTAQMSFLLRPLQIIVGTILLAVPWFIVVVIVLSNSNRLLSSHGIYTGYIMDNSPISNPLNALLLLCHKAFPLDYVVLGLMIGYFAISSVSGMQHMGMWFFWIKIHQLRAGRTPVRALLFCSLILSLVTLYSGVLAYSLAPQYVTYGTQMYLVWKNNSWHSVPCSTHAPADQCLMTRLMTLQTRLFYRMWFVGVGYFWCSWIFVLVFIISFAVALVRSRKTVAQIVVNELRERSESTEQLI